MPRSAGHSERSASAAQQAWRDHQQEPATAGAAELLSRVHGRLSQARVRELVERLQGLAHDFARQHLLDQKLPEAEKRQYTLAMVMDMRSWLFEHFRHLQRAGRG